MYTTLSNINPFFIQQLSLLRSLYPSYSQPNPFPFFQQSIFPPQTYLQKLIAPSQLLYPRKTSFTLSTQSSSPDSSLKREDSLKSWIKQEESTLSPNEKDSVESFVVQENRNNNNNQCLKFRVKKMLTYILDNFGKVKDSDLNDEKARYADEPILVKLFDALVARYSSTFKTKDEILKYITRKAFTTIRNNYKQDSTSKRNGMMSNALCKRYFRVSSDEVEKLGIDINHRESFLQVLFPYRKNCKNKSKYKDLIERLASSQEFYEDYCSFVKEFMRIMESEKEKKANLFVPFLLDCVKKGNVEEIVNYKRIPWLETWIRLAEITAEEIGVALKVRVSFKSPSKKPKLESVECSQTAVE